MDRGLGTTAATGLPTCTSCGGTERADINLAVPAPGMAKAQSGHEGTGITSTSLVKSALQKS